MHRRLNVVLTRRGRGGRQRFYFCICHLSLIEIFRLSVLSSDRSNNGSLEILLITILIPFPSSSSQCFLLGRRLVPRALGDSGNCHEPRKRIWSLDVAEFLSACSTREIEVFCRDIWLGFVQNTAPWVLRYQAFSRDFLERNR